MLVKTRKHNVGLDHLSNLEFGEVGEILEDELLDAQHFWVDIVPNLFIERASFIMIGKAPDDYTLAQQRQLVTQNVVYQFIVGKL